MWKFLIPACLHEKMKQIEAVIKCGSLTETLNAGGDRYKTANLPVWYKTARQQYQGLISHIIPGLLGSNAFIFLV